MTTEDALQIVYDLATENIISNAEVSQDAQALGLMQSKQQEACSIVRDFIINIVLEERAGR